MGGYPCASLVSVSDVPLFIRSLYTERLMARREKALTLPVQPAPAVPCNKSRLFTDRSRNSFT